MREQIQGEIEMAKEMTTGEAYLALVNMITDSIDNLANNINSNNDFGMTVGDEMHNIAFQFSRIADALEKIANK
jgi:hypothetical protein